LGFDLPTPKQLDNFPKNHPLSSTSSHYFQEMMENVIAEKSFVSAFYFSGDGKGHFSGFS